MILSNLSIQAALDEHRLVIEPEPSPRQRRPGQGECPFQTSAVDLRLGNEVSIYRGDTTPMVIDLTKGKFRELAAVTEPRMLTEDQPLVLAPHRFILGRTHERVCLPLPICQLIIEEVRGIPFRNDSQFQGQARAAGN